jgi:hypothetical protein
MTKTQRAVLHALPVPDAGRTYIVIGYNCWGKHADPEQAAKNAIREGGTNALRKFLVYDAPADAYIDDMGSICYVPTADTPTPAYRLAARYDPTAKASRTPTE